MPITGSAQEILRHEEQIPNPGLAQAVQHLLAEVLKVHQRTVDQFNEFCEQKSVTFTETELGKLFMCVHPIPLSLALSWSRTHDVQIGPIAYNSINMQRAIVAVEHHGFLYYVTSSNRNGAGRNAKHFISIVASPIQPRL
jgi:hypothetical protein